MILSLIPLIPSLIGCSNPLMVEASGSKSIYESTVLDDLTSDESFHEDIYTVDDFAVIKFMEFGYAKNSDTLFDLFFYFYLTPDKSYNVSKFSQIVAANSNNDYESYDLRVIDSNNGFYKTQVINSKSLYLDNLNTRVYNISKYTVYSRPLDDESEDKISFDVSSSFTFSGFAESMNGNDSSSLECAENTLETINLDVSVGNWLSKSSGGYRKNIFYAWFNIPNHLLDYYGYLDKVEYQYSSVVLPNYLALTEDQTIAVFNNGARTSSNSSVSWAPYTSDLNNLNNDFFRFWIPTWDSPVSRKEVELRSKQFLTPALDWTYHHIETENMEESYSITENHLNGFERWWEETFHGIAYSEFDLGDLNVWDILSTSDLGLSKSSFGSKYFVDEEDVDSIKSYLSRSSQTTYLLRYHDDDYYSENVRHEALGEYLGYYFSSHACLDFEIITFTFRKDGVSKIIPVIHSPLNNFPKGLAADVSDPWGWLKTMLMAIIPFVLAIFGGVLAFSLIKARISRPKVKIKK